MEVTAGGNPCGEPTLPLTRGGAPAVVSGNGGNVMMVGVSGCWHPASQAAASTARIRRVRSTLIPVIAAATAPCVVVLLDRPQRGLLRPTRRIPSPVDPGEYDLSD